MGITVTKAKILPVVLNGFETWSLTQMEEESCSLFAACKQVPLTFCP
jgi:hypothetical protein